MSDDLVIKQAIGTVDPMREPLKLARQVQRTTQAPRTELADVDAARAERRRARRARRVRAT